MTGEVNCPGQGYCHIFRRCFVLQIGIVNPLKSFALQIQIDVFTGKDSVLLYVIKSTYPGASIRIAEVRIGEINAGIYDADQNAFSC